MKNKLSNRNLSFKSLMTTLFLGAFLSTQAIAQSDFSKENGVVTDSNTKLQWQDDYQDNNDEIKTGTFKELQAYCAELTLLKNNDWRLPTREELLSIVDTSREDEPAIDVSFEKVTEDDGYLTTTYYEDDEETVWTVDFTHGDSLDVALIFSEGYFARCVRNL